MNAAVPNKNTIYYGKRDVTLSFESYVINASQAIHMTLMAVFVPIVIGLEQFGLFAAVFSLPGATTSFVELCFLASITNPVLRSGAIIQFLALSVIGMLVTIVFACLFFDIWFVLASVLLSTLLTLRAFIFSSVIASGAHTRQIVLSELVVLACYLAALLACFLLEQDGAIIPFVMISSGLLVSSVFLGYQTFATITILVRDSRFRNRRIFTSSSLRTALGKTFEDGFLTLQPFLLANAFSAEVAGIFRVIVTIQKAGMKLFPFRHDVVLREFSDTNKINADTTLRIQRAYNFFTIGGVLFGIPIVAFSFAQNGSVVSICLLASGFVISALAFYPAASAASTSVRWTGVFAVIVLGLTATYMPLSVFSVAFVLLSFGISRLCLRALVELQTSR